MIKNSIFDYKTALENVNEWTRNCDTKVSIILGAYGIIFSTIFSSNILYMIFKAMKKQITTYTAVYTMWFILTGLLFVFGIYKLVSVLIPRINLEHESVSFFGEVNKFNTFEDYYKKVSKLNDDLIEEDWLHQVFAASKICSRKFQLYKQGLIYSIAGFCSFVVWFTVGAIFLI